MKKIIALLSGMMFLSIPAFAQETKDEFVGKYSFDLLDNRHFSRVLIGESQAIDNNEMFVESLGLISRGVSSPSFSEKGYTFVRACKPHNCDMTYTIWAFNDNEYYSSIVVDGVTFLYGNPPDQIKNILEGK